MAPSARSRLCGAQACEAEATIDALAQRADELEHKANKQTNKCRRPRELALRAAWKRFA